MIEDIFTWKDPKTTGTIVAVVDVVLIMLFLEVSVLPFLLSYGVWMLMIGGIVAKNAAGLSFSNLELTKIWPRESYLAVMGLIYDSFADALRSVLPVIMLNDIKTSAIFLGSTYLLSILFAWVRLDFVLFLAFNVGAAYGKYSNEIHTLVGPALNQTHQILSSSVKMIPRHSSCGDMDAPVENSGESTDTKGGSNKTRGSGRKMQ